MLDLVGMPDVAVIISRTPQRVLQLYDAGRTPPVLGVLGAATQRPQPVWEREAIEIWCRHALGREPVRVVNDAAAELCRGQFEIPLMLSG